MRRRTLLRVLGAAVGVGFAGCGGSSRGDPTAEDSPGGTSDTGTKTPSTPDTPADSDSPVDAMTTSSPAVVSPTATPLNRRERWCSGYDPPLPVPTEKGDQPVSYPSYPSSLTREAALTFAADHEHAIQYNSLLETGYDDVTFTAGTPMFRADETWYGWDSEAEGYVAPDATDAEHPARAETYLVRVEGEGAAWDRRVPEGHTPRPHYDVFSRRVWYELTGSTAWRMFVEQHPDAFPPSELTFTDKTRIVCESEP